MGRTTLFDYTTIPNATKMTDPNGNVEVDYYNQGMRFQVTMGYGTPQAATTTYLYDHSTLQLTEVIDANGNTTSLAVDGSGNATAIVDPLGRETDRTYNAFNQVLTSTDPSGETT